jgi:hypothetical protein
MIKVLKKIIKNLMCGNISHKDFEKTKVLLAHNMALNKRSLKLIDDFADVEFSCFSKFGEDGIIDWLVSKLPTIPNKFVEFGVEDYHESNTRLLLQLRNWQGLIMDGSNDYIQDIRAQDISWRHHIDSKCAHITKENINSLLAQNEMTGEIGLLSIDIDGNDYYVWQAIDVIFPAIVIIEYNAVFGDIHPVVVPYRSDFFRTKAHSSNLYFGASLPALILLGKEKGYTFVGTNTIGADALFIRDDLAPKITSLLGSISAYPSYFREARDRTGKLLLLGGLTRSGIISNSLLFDVKNKENTSINKLGEIYSSNWKNGQKNIF